MLTGTTYQTSTSFIVMVLLSGSVSRYPTVTKLVYIMVINLLAASPFTNGRTEVRTGMGRTGSVNSVVGLFVCGGEMVQALTWILSAGGADGVVLLTFAVHPESCLVAPCLSCRGLDSYCLHRFRPLGRWHRNSR